MGNWWSGDTVPREDPNVIDVQHLLSKDPTAIKSFLTDLRQLGYSVIRLDAQSEDLLRQFETCAQQFFELDQKTKDEFVGKEKDPLLAEIGPRPNIGYIKTRPKEYLKIRGSDPIELVPSEPPGFRDVFKKTSDFLADLGDHCLEYCGTCLTPSGAPYMTEAVLKSARDLALDGSSVSTIRYFKQVEKPEPANVNVPDEYGNVNAEKEGDEGLRLGIHADTGLLTFIRAARTPGLQIENRVTKEYFTAEKKFESEKHIFCITGRKLDMMAADEKIFIPTLHRVLFDPSVERYSLLYFMDFRK
jgi:isopenicillin N synthase-like dioxygenase